MARGRQPRCNHKVRTGYVTNQPDGYDKTRAHASTMVCSREVCIEDAKRWVKAVTQEEGVLVLYPTEQTHEVIEHA
jgi:hypothetical protein